MLNKIVYTYYHWYILLTFTITCAALSLAAFIIHISYRDPSSESLFWFGIGLFIMTSLIAIIYLPRIISYRLVLEGNTLQEWFKSVPFGKSRLHFTITLPDANGHLDPAHSDPISKEYEPNTEISIFCNGFAPIRQRLSLREYLIMEHQDDTNYPPVPSLSTFRRHQQHCLTPFWLVPTMLFCISQIHSSLHPIFNVLAYVLFISILSYLWYTFSKLPKVYFWYTLEIIKPPIPFVLSLLTILFLYSLLLKLSISSSIPFAVASFILTIILHWRYGHLFYSRAYYLTFLCLPFALFGLLLAINCTPTGKPAASVQAPIYAKQQTDKFPVHFSVDIDIWGDGKPTGFDLKSSIYDQVEVGDTLSFTIHRGLLGVRWIKNPSTIDDLLIQKTKP